MLYARFIGDTVDYVANQLIETTLVKDKEFAAWRAEKSVDAAAPASPTDVTGPARRRATGTP